MISFKIELTEELEKAMCEQSRMKNQVFIKKEKQKIWSKLKTFWHILAVLAVCELRSASRELWRPLADCLGGNRWKRRWLVLLAIFLTYFLHCCRSTSLILLMLEFCHRRSFLVHLSISLDQTCMFARETVSSCAIHGCEPLQYVQCTGNFALLQCCVPVDIYKEWNTNYFYYSNK